MQGFLNQPNLNDGISLPSGLPQISCPSQYPIESAYLPTNNSYNDFIVIDPQTYEKIIFPESEIGRSFTLPGVDDSEMFLKHFENVVKVVTRYSYGDRIPTFLHNQFIGFQRWSPMVTMHHVIPQANWENGIGSIDGLGLDDISLKIFELMKGKNDILNLIPLDKDYHFKYVHGKKGRVPTSTLTNIFLKMNVVSFTLSIPTILNNLSQPGLPTEFLQYRNTDEYENLLHTLGCIVKDIVNTEPELYADFVQQYYSAEQ